MNRARGFTLLEVMISLTLLSLVMVATLAALRTFGNTRSTVTEVTGRVDEIRGVSEFLRNSIGAAMPVMRAGVTTERFTDGLEFGTHFTGDATYIEWVSPLVAGADMGGVFIMRLALVDDKLQLQWLPYRRDLEEAQWSVAEPRSLVGEVDEFEIGYLAAYGQQWQETWTPATQNPVAVRINLRNAGRYWPELIIRLSGAPLNAR